MGVDIGDEVHLWVDCVADAVVAVAVSGDGSAGGGVEDLAPGGEGEVAAFCGDGMEVEEMLWWGREGIRGELRTLRRCRTANGRGSIVGDDSKRGWTESRTGPHLKCFRENNTFPIESYPATLPRPAPPCPCCTTGI